MYEKLPAFVQPALTALTGKPVEGEAASRRTPWHHLFTALTAHVCGVAGSAYFVVHGGLTFLLLPITMLFALHGARKLRNVIMHQCAHDNFIRNRRFDRNLGKAISIALVTEEFDHYKISHIDDHHSSRHQTILDPTVAFLFQDLRIRPGMSSREMWKRLFLTVLSPAYHIRFLAGRVRSHFVGTSLRHRAIICAYLINLLLALKVTGAWNIFLIAWLLPVTVLYQISTAFRLASRHIFIPKLPKKRNKASLGTFTLGIFIGAPCPDRGLGVVSDLGQWIWWCAQMIFYHVPCRLGVLVGDGPAHDFHHRHPRFPDWANYIYARANDERDPGDGWPAYREVWGLHRAIDETFKSLSAANPDDYPIDAKASRKPEE